MVNLFVLKSTAKFESQSVSLLATFSRVLYFGFSETEVTRQDNKTITFQLVFFYFSRNKNLQPIPEIPLRKFYITIYSKRDWTGHALNERHWICLLPPISPKKRRKITLKVDALVILWPTLNKFSLESSSNEADNKVSYLTEKLWQGRGDKDEILLCLETAAFYA